VILEPGESAHFDIECDDPVVAQAIQEGRATLERGPTEQQCSVVNGLEYELEAVFLQKMEVWNGPGPSNSPRRKITSHQNFSDGILASDQIPHIGQKLSDCVSISGSRLLIRSRQ
jgi:hypothetical protein